ncbi:unnamed protein product [Moneuplotes crassus]|uniref:Uncharacterized protein n=1 Tax=Euplotes crassus TaxID=5936 RepID=A0AAD1UNW2_EUPCR|nr:unnamed protein product [Moneuplotes crassus]
MFFSPRKDERDLSKLNLKLPNLEFSKRRVSAFPGFKDFNFGKLKKEKSIRTKKESKLFTSRNNLKQDFSAASSVPSLEEVIIPERNLPIDKLENYVSSKEKRVPIFGYPIISFHLNSKKEDKIKFLWSLIAKKIISLDTKKCLIKHFLDGNKAYQAKESNIFTSFTYGASPSKSRISLEETDTDFSEDTDSNINSSRLLRPHHLKNLNPRYKGKGKRINSARRNPDMRYKNYQSLTKYLNSGVSKYSPSPAPKIKIAKKASSKSPLTREEKKIMKKALQSSIFKPMKKKEAKLCSRSTVRIGRSHKFLKGIKTKLQPQWLPKFKKAKRREKQEDYKTIL